MNNSVVVFFITSTNHLSNVKTLQSILKQDYENINLVVCNDCTYGFENERLLNNFQEYRSENIQQIYFHENTYPMGDFQSFVQIGKRVNSEFIMIIRSGEYFVTNSALRSAIKNLKLDTSLDAALMDVEYWTNDMLKKSDEITAVNGLVSRTVFNQNDANKIACTRIRDCMVIYRRSTLFESMYLEEEESEFIGQYLVRQLLEKGKRVVYLPSALCKYSDNSIQYVEKAIPKEFGNGTLKKIEKMLVETRDTHGLSEEPLFQDIQMGTRKVVKKKNKNILLYNLSSFTRIKSYLMLSLLLFIAAAMFLHLETLLFITMGKCFILLALVVSIWAIIMVGCNLYFKKNPQRLVIHNEK